LHAEGHSIKEMAGLLDISEKTVEFHKRHIQELFNLRSNAALTLFAVKQGLIEINP
jgi:DNA-binding CsgD family transcriptional regulator